MNKSQNFQLEIITTKVIKIDTARIVRSCAYIADFIEELWEDVSEP
ncbi:hypothetical protein QWT69_00830 [Sporosarcina oncorhynchi]|uniref:Uncharacterized protein n=1 Tax=Sporosarcina oncorhynchi TaxID=3056444 RepID=A0ABZ0L5E4_9BACL|nr:hypothetical protein [Sporosarcina sp. T2O-4]WOV87698.1 hypothetical protein QWT69_00830 [Sporosarcina sp. T2O-4]